MFYTHFLVKLLLMPSIVSNDFAREHASSSLPLMLLLLPLLLACSSVSTTLR